MTQLRPPRVAPARAAWRGRVDDLARVAGPFPGELEAAWRVELDAAQARMPLTAEAGGGVHALLALAGARLGESWQPRWLIDLAAAVELAHQAIRSHAGVRDGPPGDVVRRAHNVKQVLDGDFAITQAAVLAAGVSPAAYRMLVRGYGACQVASLRPDAESASRLAPLAVAALGLGALAAGVPDIRLPPEGDSPIRQVWCWALALGDRS